MILQKEQIEEVTNLLTHQIEGVKGIYLFGSGTGPDFTDESDVDLALLPQNPISTEMLWKLKNQLSDLVHREVDLVDLSVANTVLAMQVISGGVRLYSSEPLASERYESLIFSMYLTLNDDRKGILEEIEKNKTIYG
ncbi:type VII toxin-antitoxin system MntA family adenylyltransferase antitoxin [Marinoscillum sp.]|uniref:type VII toxin-antitoxin system MntA family adenylyltransferase antitoxin n=1 Tax=Marinoscillum sp. TaxID=2024838 RepID=UPI003BA9AE8C